jgi:ferritin
MLKKSVQDAINEQIKNEFDSAYLYLAMAAHFESVNLPGFAHWMKLQHQEETAHGMKFFNYIIEREGTVMLKKIDAPQLKFDTPLDVFKQVLKHEQKVTKSINELYELALKEKDYPSQIMLQWFIQEQLEEEKNANNIIIQLEMIGDAPAGMLIFDRQLAARTAG